MRGDRAGLWKAVAGLHERSAAPGRETLRRMIEFQQLWLRDLLRARYGAPREIAGQPRPRGRDPRARPRRIDATEIRRRLMVLEEALRSIEGNVTPDLALFSAMSRLNDPSLEEAEWPRHAIERYRY